MATEALAPPHSDQEPLLRSATRDGPLRALPQSCPVPHALSARPLRWAGAFVVPPAHTGLMTRDDYRHPMTSLWQRILNAHPVPERRRQHDLPGPVPVRARVIWERDGEETKDGRVVATSRVRGQAPLVLVHWAGAEPRSQTLGAWLTEADVERVNSA